MIASQLLCYHRPVRWLNQKILLTLLVLLFLSALPFSQPADPQTAWAKPVLDPTTFAGKVGYPWRVSRLHRESSTLSSIRPALGHELGPNGTFDRALQRDWKV